MATSFVPEARKVVMISSTARDLPQHREQARKACALLKMSAWMMEDLTALDKTVVQVCKNMVEQSHFYIGIFGQRYGTIPKGSPISFTEIECRHAIKLKIPCFFFLMDDDHFIKKSEIDCRNERKLKNLMRSFNNAKTPIYFKSPDDLYGKIIGSLVPYLLYE